jgi:hypothetical protein
MGGGRNGEVEAPLTARNRTDARCMGLGRFGFGRGWNIGSGTASIAAASVARRGSARASLLGAWRRRAQGPAWLPGAGSGSAVGLGACAGRCPGDAVGQGRAQLARV